MCGNIGDIEQASSPAELFLAASPNACLDVYLGVHVSRGQMQCLAPTSFIPVTLNSLRSVSGTRSTVGKMSSSHESYLPEDYPKVGVQ